MPSYPFSVFLIGNIEISTKCLLYEGDFNTKYETRSESGKHRNVVGTVGSGVMNRLMILSRPALHQGFADPRTKSNVGFHEFVHLLDKVDGSIDGIPQNFIAQPYIMPWLKMVHNEIKEMKSSRTDINIYGASNEAEFLSVVSEYFFNQPLLLKRKHPRLFDLLERIFNQDLDHSSEVGS